MSLYFPAKGTAGFVRSRVKGKSREPTPPPKITATTSSFLIVAKASLPPIIAESGTPSNPRFAIGLCYEKADLRRHSTPEAISPSSSRSRRSCDRLQPEGLNKDDLCVLAHLHELHRANNIIYYIAKIVLGEFHHIHRQLAGIHFATRI